MTIHLGDELSRRGTNDSTGPFEGPWPRLPRPNVTLRNKKRAVTADPDNDTFECEQCHRVFDIDDSIKTNKKGPMLCVACDQQTRNLLQSDTDRFDWITAASDSEDTGGDTDWDDDAYCECLSCRHPGIVKDFKIKTRKRK